MTNVRWSLFGVVATGMLFLLGPRGTAVVASPVVAPAGAGSPADTVDAPAPPPEWQQEVGYTIEARLDEEDQVLRAAQVVRYRNASPDTLRSLYFHLYLNAFRPHSVWARNEQRERLDFGALEEPDYGFERLQSVALVEGAGAGGAGAGDEDGGGTTLEPVYPHAPDSTVVRLDLPEPLAPGERAVLHMRWDARPATLCRRQCREGRSWDLAQWYPRAAVYDGGGWQAHPLYPQGEFYGEFATYDVTLDLAEDQVVGATGVPVEGDPGWEPEEGSPRSEPLYQRDHYGHLHEPADPGLLDDEPAEGRRRVRFRAERVHHFGWSTSPDYRYEGDVFERGALPDVAVHVLYRPGDDDWDDGVAAERTIRALSWLETVFRPYPYPQITNLHRLEGGGTEFPMLIMDGSASEGLIVHEMTHQYAHGILANNEWKEAWLDEGLTSFIDTWYSEEHGEPGVWTGVMERTARSEPAPMAIANRSEDFPNYSVYGHLSYSKPRAVFYMLREMLGKETMRRILRTYYDRYAFRHVNEAALRTVAEEVSNRELDWFFDQWLHTTATLDWRVASATAYPRSGEDGWRTRVELRREGEAWMPVTLRISSEAGSRDVRVEARDRTATVEVRTPWKPAAVELDPDRQILDADRSNDTGELFYVIP